MDVSLRQTHSAGPEGVHLKADLEGTIFAYDFCVRLAYVKTFDHLEGPQQGSQMLPACPFVFPFQSCYPAFFMSESRSRPIFSFEFLPFIIQCLRLTFLQQRALMFKVLDVAISDRSFFFCFAYFFIFFIYLFSEHISTKQKVYFDLSSGHLETAS